MKWPMSSISQYTNCRNGIYYYTMCAVQTEPVIIAVHGIHSCPKTKALDAVYRADKRLRRRPHLLSRALTVT